MGSRRESGIEPGERPVIARGHLVLLEWLQGFHCTVAAMAHHRSNHFSPYFSFTLWYERFSSSPFSFLRIPLRLLLWCCQAAQITHMLDERMGELAEEAKQERALKDVVDATARDKGKTTEVAEKKAQSSKKAQLLVEKRSTEVEIKLGETELKLSQAESLNLAHVKEVAELKAAPDACENKWYNKGFVDAENSVKPIVH